MKYRLGDKYNGDTLVGICETDSGDCWGLVITKDKVDFETSPWFSVHGAIMNQINRVDITGTKYQVCPCDCFDSGTLVKWVEVKEGLIFDDLAAIIMELNNELDNGI